MLIYAVILPALALAIAGLLRFRFAIQIWRKLYIVGLAYVALVLIRLVMLWLG
ncbi:MAG: hypothetical protein U0531_12285 [Dehalococcoidia bacterium]